MAKTTLTKTDLLVIDQLRADGVSVRTIAKVLNRTFHQIRYALNPTLYRQRSTRWRLAHAQENAATQRRYYRKHRKQLTAYARNYYVTHRVAIRAHQRLYSARKRKAKAG